MRRYRAFCWVFLLLLAAVIPVGADSAKPLRKYTVILATREDFFPEVAAMAKVEPILRRGLSHISAGPVKLSREDNLQLRVVFTTGATEDEVRVLFFEEPNGLNFRLDGQMVLYCVNLTVEAGTEHGQSRLIFTLGPLETEQLARLTRENLGQKIAVCLGETVLMEPIVEEPITDGRGRIMLGRAAPEEAAFYAAQMELAALPVPLRIKALQNEAPDPLAVLTAGPLGTIVIFLSALAVLTVGAVVAFALLLRRANRRAEGSETTAV